MKDYLPCINMGRQLLLDLKTINATKIQDYPFKIALEAAAMIIMQKIWEGNSPVRFQNYKTNCNLGYLPCMNMGRQLVLD